jgi:glycosyltransferase involved in cell wall biosynthesis
MVEPVPELPRVVVITPVFRGASHLGECLAAVRGQSHPHWRHIVVDNASDDDTRVVAAAVCADDPRVRLVTHQVHVPLLDNWNRAMAECPADSEYVMQIGADDRLSDDCFARMIDIAERHPSAKLIAAYRTDGDITLPERLDAGIELIPGRDAARAILLGGPDVVGSPSNVMMRRDAIPARGPMYDARPWPPGLHDAPSRWAVDKEPFLRMLARTDVAFSHSVLTHSSRENRGATSVTEELRTHSAGDLELLVRCAEGFLTEPELRRRARSLALRYAAIIANQALRRGRRRDARFVEYHSRALAHLIPALRDVGASEAATALGAAHRMLTSTSAAPNESIA